VHARAHSNRPPLTLGIERLVFQEFGERLPSLEIFKQRLKPAVVAELSQDRSPALVKTWLSNKPEWLHVQASTTQAQTTAQTGLGAGEREAVALAAELSADAASRQLRSATAETTRCAVEDQAVQTLRN
jgi:hypothetical protein